MTTVQQLTSLAIDSASKTQWEEAKEKNTQILEIEPQNIGALNRLAFCQMQLGKYSKARELYEEVLKIERFNPIASKYLGVLKQRVKPQPLPQVTMGVEFIEEPGKTKSVSLQRLSDPDVLQSIPTGMKCTLVVKNHRVNVVGGSNIYLGSLPDDIAFRLQKLISAGNTYTVLVQSTSKKSCVVFIKETHRSLGSPYATSFPLGSSRGAMMQEDVVLDETPLDTRETGNEDETVDIEERDFME